MKWTGPEYRRTLDLRYLRGKKCERCGKIYLSSRNFCSDCGREGNLSKVNLPKRGEVYSSSLIRKSTSDFGLDSKIPYAVGLMDLEGVDFKAPGIIESEERITGEKVEAEIGLLGESNEIKFYTYIWRKPHEYHEPEPSSGTCSTEKGVGIVDYGVYVPRKRISSEKIAEVWGEEMEGLVKSFPGKWDDAGAYAMNSALNSLKNNEVDPADIDKIMVGSESHPYAVNPTSSIVAELIGADKQCVDFEFACKAGTQAIIEAYDSIKAGMSDYALAIGMDSAQAEPGGALEYTAGDGGACLLMGSEKPVVVINAYESFSTDTPDFLRGEAREFPVHFGRFTGEPAYFKHIETAANRLMEAQSTQPEDYDYAVFHQPNSKFPRKVGKRLGFEEDQIEPAIVVDWIGNTYSACVPLGLCRVLDQASPGERIFVTSYGSGAGSDAFDMTVTERIKEKQKQKRRSIDSWIGKEDEELLEFESYGKYAKNKGLLRG
ncbi:MAG: hydroxymethylglutaryl-CoA synthase [Candidatus Aenigmatarchaeota archaeon]